MNNYQLYSNYCALLIEMKDGKEKSFKFFLFVQKKKKNICSRLKLVSFLL